METRYSPSVRRKTNNKKTSRPRSSRSHGSCVWENTGATWLGGATAAAPGVRFKSKNSAGKKEWSTTGTIVEASPGRVLSFRVTAVGAKVALWTYRFEPTDTGCRVTESWEDERNAFVNFMGKPVSGVADRATHNRAGMEETLRRLKAAAEA